MYPAVMQGYQVLKYYGGVMNIVERRKELGYKQNELAKMLGINKAALSNLEKRPIKIRTIHFGTYMKLCDILYINPRDLQNIDENGNF